MTAALGIPSQSASSADASRARERKTTAHDDSLSAFMSVRPRLFGIAYRMLGNAAEAEDIVQDVWVRWQTTDRSVVRDAAAFLVTTATRLAINVMHSARSRRETCAESWLLEPVDASADPGLEAERDEGLKAGIVRLLESLSPTERAGYILREAFDYSYRDIANVLRLEEANARQVVTRARQHVANGRRMPANSTQQRRLHDAFTAAARHGDVVVLEDLLASEVVSISGGGGFAVAGRPSHEHVLDHLLDRARRPAVPDEIGAEFAERHAAERHVVTQDFDLSTVLDKRRQCAMR